MTKSEQARISRAIHAPHINRTIDVCPLNGLPCDARGHHCLPNRCHAAIEQKEGSK